MNTETSIRITANGKPFSVSSGRALSDFLRELGLEAGMVVVEKNGEALTPSETRGAVLGDGDRLEIVQITAGG